MQVQVTFKTHRTERSIDVLKHKQKTWQNQPYYKINTAHASEDNN